MWIVDGFAWGWEVHPGWEEKGACLREVGMGGGPAQSLSYEVGVLLWC